MPTPNYATPRGSVDDMADPFDVAARLAEGLPAVDNTQSYVWACHLLGYQNPDLTLHGSQVRDWYGSEDGLDLRVLDGDCAALDATVTATEEALRIQCAQLAELPAVWAGGGAEAAHGFLRRHCDNAGSAAALVRTAAEACAALRDNLWQMVDGKVAAAVAVDDRRLAERPAWLAAARTVETGAGDRSTAGEVVDQQIKPFVDNDIRTDWLTAMRSTMTSVAASYDAATRGLTAGSGAQFEVPGDLGPRYLPSQVDPVATIGDSAREQPMPARGIAPAAPAAGWPAGAPREDYWPGTPADLMPVLPPAAPVLPPAPGGMPSAPGMGAGGLGSLAGRIADALSGPPTTSADALADPPTPDDPLPQTGDTADDGVARDDADNRDGGTDEGTDDGTEEPEPGDDCDEPAPLTMPTPAADPLASEPELPAPEPLPAAAPQPPPPNPAPAAEGSTPCEIAADELPQAGR